MYVLLVAVYVWMGITSEHEVWAEKASSNPETKVKTQGNKSSSNVKSVKSDASDASNDTNTVKGAKSDQKSKSKKKKSKIRTREQGYRTLEEFVQGEMERIKKLDIYGMTAQLPKGYLAVKWGWTMLRADQRYNAQGELGPVFPPIEFDLDGEKQLSADLGLNGEGGSHNFMVSYGITDHFNYYLQVPLTYMHVRFNPKVNDIDEEGNKVGRSMASLFGIRDRQRYNASNLLYDTFNSLGRPTPGSEFKGSWLLGDVNTGFSWNYLRTYRYSAGLVARVFLPTAHIPPAERNLFFGTGPEIQIGNGGWGTGFSQLYDLRIFKIKDFQLTASTELNVAYFFTQKRDYPTNFVEPDSLATQLDPASFPDLSHLEGTFDYTPGWGFALSGQLDLTYGPLGLGVGYGTRFAQKPEINGDQAFMGMVDSLELLAETSAQILRVGSSLSLLPIYIPAQISFSWDKVVGGRNVIVYTDNYTIQLNLILPVFMLWN